MFEPICDTSSALSSCLVLVPYLNCPKNSKQENISLSWGGWGWDDVVSGGVGVGEGDEIREYNVLVTLIT